MEFHGKHLRWARKVDVVFIDGILGNETDARVYQGCFELAFIFAQPGSLLDARSSFDKPGMGLSGESNQLA